MCQRTDKTSTLGSVVLASSAQRLNLKLGALELSETKLSALVAPSRRCYRERSELDGQDATCNGGTKGSRNGSHDARLSAAENVCLLSGLRFSSGG